MTAKEEEIGRERESAETNQLKFRHVPGSLKLLKPPMAYSRDLIGEGNCEARQGDF